MSKITVEEVEALAQLARVGLSNEEKESLAEQMSEILSYAKQLDEVDTDKVSPTSQVTQLSNVYREDVVLKSELTRDQLLANTPETDSGSIKVKAVL